MLELLLAAVIGAPALVRDYRVSRFIAQANERHLTLTVTLPDPLVPPPAPGRIERIESYLPNSTEGVVLLNFPAAFVDLAVSWPMHRSLRDSPLVFTFDRWAWRALVYPLYALPFWWILGRSVDCGRSLRNKDPKRLRWWDLALMLPLAVLGIAALTAPFTSIPADRADAEFEVMIVAIWFWGALSVGACVIWFLQWRRRRRLTHVAAG